MYSFHLSVDSSIFSRLSRPKGGSPLTRSIMIAIISVATHVMPITFKSISGVREKKIEGFIGAEHTGPPVRASWIRCAALCSHAYAVRSVFRTC